MNGWKLGALAAVSLAAVIGTVAGCARQEGETPPAAAVEIPENMSGIAELPASDQAAALRQKICPVTEEPLGSMGKPIEVSVQGREIFVCCESCVADYKRDLDDLPTVAIPHPDDQHRVPGYPQMMQHQHMSPEQMQRIQGRREVQGMRKMWHMGVHGLMTVLRVLPEDLYARVMESDEPVASGAIFEEVVQRRTDQGQ
ncbi:MAG: hypothetical protein WD066_03520 [Planctomycetaceae bacterium]